MKPNFALDLSHDGIGLLHRGVDGWHTVGNVSLEDAEFGDKLGYLRQTAAALESGGITTKLVIPNTQILYTTVDADGPTEGERRSQIRKALVGATPYDIDDLVFDWSIIDGTVQVAAVARETLVEAEGFANEYGFNPVSFVATPIDGTFSETEPFFGTSEFAKSILDSEDPFEQDQEVIRILGPELALEPKMPADDEPQIEEMPESVVDAPETDEDQEVDEAFDETIDTESVTEQTLAMAMARVQSNKHVPAEAKSVAPEPQDDPVEAPVKQTNVTSPQLPDLDDESTVGATPTFASRREGTTDADDIYVLDRIEKTESRLAILPEGKASLAPALSGVSRKVEKTIPEPAPTPPPAKPPVFDQPDLDIAEQNSQVPDAQSEEQAMTVFGARKKPVQRGKPRYLGLSLMLLLLVILAAIVLWSTYFLSDDVAFWRGDQTDTDIIATPEPMQIPTPVQAPAPVQTDTAAVTPQPDPDTAVADALALLTEPTIRRDIPPEVVIEPEPMVTIEPEPEQTASLTPLPDTPVPLTPQAAQDAYLDNGIWQRAPKPPNVLREDVIDTLYITSVDPEIVSQDAIALPSFSGSNGDIPLEVQSSPAAHSTAFILDERGFVLPSAEGTMTPDGVLVFAGPPPVKPKFRGNRVPQVVIEPDLSLAGFRPQARPADLVQQVQTVQETEQLGGYTRSQLAALRPKPRPYEVRPPQNINEPEVEEEAVAKTESEGPVSDLAVVLANVPKHRPRNFAKVVERARASAPSERATAATAVPRAQTVTPSAPTRASVARLATTKNAINLRRTSLIGVYGSPSKRRALVRLSNGRYVKVQVGQRVDGGKVAAIGQSELRYVKGGRTIILRMPKS